MIIIFKLTNCFCSIFYIPYQKKTTVPVSAVKSGVSTGDFSFRGKGISPNKKATPRLPFPAGLFHGFPVGNIPDYSDVTLF
jgi:hypothetical protein